MNASRPQWRSLLEDPALTARAFPSLAPMLDEKQSRRHVLKLMAASMALGGLAGCDPAAPNVSYIPSVIAAPGIVAGRPNRYATASLASG
jgi:molybdopterin-containing oxidoreductase family iron-sulfur binding subunit